MAVTLWYCRFMLRTGSCELHLAVEKEAEDTESLERYMQSHLPPYMLPRQHPLHSLFPTKQQQQN